MNQRYSLLKNFLTDRQVASVARSSRYAAETLRNLVGITRNPVNKILELGPGDGALTTTLLDLLAPDGKLIAIELNPEVAKVLKDSISDSRLEVVVESAAHLERVCDHFEIRPDLVVSGIPFSFLPLELRESIVQQIRSTLSKSGKFIAYQAYLPPFVQPSSLHSLMQEHFGTVTEDLQLLNVPPLKFLTASGIPTELPMAASTLR